MPGPVVEKGSYGGRWGKKWSQMVENGEKWSKVGE
jgi:hypothetical protein